MHATPKEHLLDLFNQGPVVVYTCRPSGDFAATSISDNITAQLGYEPREFLDDPRFWVDHIHPGDRQRVLAGVGRIFEEESYSHEYRFLHRDGSYRWMHDQLELARDEQGKPLEMVGYWLDVTNRKEVEEELRRKEKQFRSLLESAPDAIVIADSEGKIVLTNAQTEKLFGYERGEIVGEKVELLLPAAVRDKHVAERRKYHSAPKVRPMGNGSDLAGRRKDGSEFPVDVSLSPIDTENGTLVAASVRDVTERHRAAEEKRRLEARLFQAQKMQAVGVLAGGIAHDFNNILGSIVLFVELAKSQLQEPPEAEKSLNQVLRASARAKDLVLQILAFGRGEEPELKPVSAEKVVKEALNLLRSSVPAGIEVRQNISPDCGGILADATQMHQVIVNLCTNACQAMERSGGLMEIDLRPIEVDSQFIQRHPELQTGPYVRLTVRDNGTGIDPAIQDRVFDPFFTTKEVGAGTGLGLAVVHGIVKSHHGAIDLRSEPGEGTQVAVYLPQLEGEVVTQPADTEANPAGSEHILFVDDEEMLAEVSRLTLEKLGHKVTTQVSSVEALNLFRAQAWNFDLVISDVTMPKMNGIELARKLLEIRPDIPIILATGFTDLIKPDEAASIGIREVLNKPYSLRDLGETIRRVLDKPEEPDN